MDDEAEFIARLIGLSVKEARTLHLLKYGLKTPSLLAKSLKTYREDIHRTLTALIDKGIYDPRSTLQLSMQLSISMQLSNLQ